MTESNEPLSLAGTPAAPPLGYYSWMLGQAAREPLYVMAVIYIFFPYFSNVVVGDPIRGQTLIGNLQALSGLIMALTIPFLGSIADKIGRRKPWIVSNHIVMGLVAITFWWMLPEEGGLSLNASLALLLVFLIAFGYAEVFHNAMLPSVAPANKAGILSGMAFSAGNLCAITFMLVILIGFALPGMQDWSFLPDQTLFGIDQSTHGHDRIVGPIGAIWLLLATLPLVLFTPDSVASKQSISTAVRQGLGDVVTTVRQLKHYSNIAFYLLARMFYNDGVMGVVMFSGVYASGTFGWDATSMLLLGLCTTASAMLGVYLGGLLDDKLGSLTTLRLTVVLATLTLLTLVSIQPGTVLFFITVSTEPAWAFPYFKTVAEIFYFLAFQIFAALALTSLSASRTFMGRICPPEKATQFFGLYGLSGTVTLFLGPLMVATTTDWLQSQQLGFASLIVLMLIGALILLKVKQEQSVVAPSE